MKVLQAIGLLCASLLPLGVRADEPRKEIDVQALAQVEAIQRFCARVKPHSMKDLPDLAASLIGQTSPAELEKARKSDDYREAYDAATAQLEQVDQAEAGKACEGAPSAG